MNWYDEVKLNLKKSGQYFSLSRASVCCPCKVSSKIPTKGRRYCGRFILPKKRSIYCLPDIPTKARLAAHSRLLSCGHRAKSKCLRQKELYSSATQWQNACLLPKILRFVTQSVKRAAACTQRGTQ